jgi:O-antigen/teichoic acid export membrane protein
VAAVPLSGALFLFLLFARADVPLVAGLAGTDAAGLLVGGYRPVELFSMLPMSLIFALYPALSRQLRKDGAQAQRTMEKVLILAMVLMAGATVGLVFESGLAVRILYPPALHAASSVLAISAWTLIPATIDSATTAMLLAQGRYKAALGPMALGVITLIGLNLLLDRGMGADGAAIARVVAQVVGTGSKMLLVIRFYANSYLLTRLAGIGLATVVLGLILIAGGRSPFLAMPIGVVAYLLVLLVLRVVSRADLVAIKGGFARQPAAEAETGN